MIAEPSIILIKATGALALGLTVTWLAGRARASVRHWVLACTFGVLLGVPLVTALAPALELEVAAAPALPEAPSVTRAATPAEAPPVFVAPPPAAREMAVPLPPLLSIVWMAGAALFLAGLASSLWRARLLRRGAVPWVEGQAAADALSGSGRPRRTAVLVHDQVTAPLAFGLLRLIIVLPAAAREWSDAELRRALVHELEHLHRRDWPVQICARVACALYWFHPLVWIAWRRLRLESERACDDAVVSHAMPSEPVDYAEQLLLLAERLTPSRPQPGLAMAGSDLSIRVRAVLDGRQRRGRAGSAAAAAIAGCAALFVATVAPIRAVEAAPAAAKAAPARPVQRANPAAHALAVGLVEAAGHGDVAAITQLLAAGADVNAAVPGDGSPLIAAAREGRVDAVRLLLSRGADVNLAVDGDGNPLIMAARQGHTDLVNLLLDRGAAIDRVVPGDENALIQASASGQLGAVQLLVRRGARVDTRVWVPTTLDGKQGEWRTPLGMARRHNRAAVVRFLLDHGARQ